MTKPNLNKRYNYIGAFTPRFKSAQIRHIKVGSTGKDLYVIGASCYTLEDFWNNWEEEEELSREQLLKRYSCDPQIKGDKDN